MSEVPEHPGMNEVPERSTGVPDTIEQAATADDAATGEQPVLHALQQRRSHSKVTDDAPSDGELASLVAAMSHVSDHSGLRPWRLLSLRGDRRDALGRALAEAAGDIDRLERHVSKARRAPLVIAVVVSPREHKKVPQWEQEAVAAGVAHMLSLLLHEAGWGTIWRTGPLTRSEPVRQAHALRADEYLLGWLYVGGVPAKDQKPKPRKPIDVDAHLAAL